MTDLQWEEFIEQIVQKGRDVNLKEICKEKHVGLNTLYRKLSILQKKNLALYQEFISLHPYKPRDTQGIDFEQLMRESIITGISQKDLEKKYDISKRTIQRKFAKIEEENFELYNIYQIYVDALKSGKQLHHTILEEVISEYIPQKVMTEKEKLEDRRKQFIESMKKVENRQTKNHYREEIKRVERQIEKNEEDNKTENERID